MASLEIVLTLHKVFNSIFGMLQESRALDEAENYLCGKYGLSVDKEMIPSTNFPHWDNLYGPEWHWTLSRNVQTILNSYSVSLETAEVCRDFIMLIAVLKHRAGKSYRESSDYSCTKTMFKSPTYSSIENLSRGIGSEVSLQIIHRELGDWARRAQLL
jgi:hypothetical protein